MHISYFGAVLTMAAGIASAEVVYKHENNCTYEVNDWMEGWSCPINEATGESPAPPQIDIDSVLQPTLNFSQEVSYGHPKTVSLWGDHWNIEYGDDGVDRGNCNHHLLCLVSKQNPGGPRKQPIELVGQKSIPFGTPKGFFSENSTYWRIEYDGTSTLDNECKGKTTCHIPKL